MTDYLKRATKVIVTVAVAALLFGDTVAHYWSPRNDDHTLRFSHFGTYDDYLRWRNVITRFEQANPGVHVTQEYVPGWYGRYDTKLRQSIVAGSPPDVALVQAGPFANIQQHFADVNSLCDDAEASILDDLDPIGVRQYLFDPSQSALPVSGGTLLIYCNKSSFDKASQYHGQSIPLPDGDWTMDQFMQLARELTCDFDGDQRIDQFGFWSPRWLYYLPFIWSQGANILDADESHWTLTGDNTVRAFDFYQRMHIGDDRVCPTPQEVSQIIQDVGFVTGKTAMCVNGPWLRPFLKEAGMLDRIHVAPIPRGQGGRRTRVTWDGIAIADTLPPARRQTAWRFVRFVLTEEAQRVLTADGRAIPALVKLQKDMAAGVESDPFVESLACARLQPQTEHFSTIDRAMHRHIGALIRQDDPIDATAFLNEVANDPALAPLAGASR